MYKAAANEKITDHLQSTCRPTYMHVSVFSTAHLDYNICRKKSTVCKSTHLWCRQHLYMPGVRM